MNTIGIALGMMSLRVVSTPHGLREPKTRYNRHVRASSAGSGTPIG
jgi:hypothetical protein